MLTKRIDEARRAYAEKNLSATIIAHDPARIKDEFWHKTSQGRYIGPAIYGASDGIITTFAVVAGVAGAKLAPAIVLIMGLANLLADGLSMAIGDYLSGRAEQKYQKSERERELWEIEHYPEGEKEEIKYIFQSKGVTGESLDQLVEIITSDQELWLDTMMTQELGITTDDDTSPVKSATVTFLSFIIAGFMPLLAYILSSFLPAIQAYQFLAACVITGITLFAVGAAKVLVTGEKWYVGGLEMLVVGGISASVAYLIGFLLGGIVGA